LILSVFIGVHLRLKILKSSVLAVMLAACCGMDEIMGERNHLPLASKLGGPTAAASCPQSTARKTISSRYRSSVVMNTRRSCRPLGVISPLGRGCL
jgi:hypothetical protein